MSRTRPGESFFTLLLQGLSGLVLFFILAPLVGLLLTTSFAEISETAADAEVRRSIGLTLWTAMLATLLCALPSIPLAYLLARKRGPMASLLSAIVDLPIVIPHAAAGIALLTVLSGDSPLVIPAETLGLKFVGSPLGIMVAMAFVSVPFLIHSAREGFAGVPERLEKAALNLGASPSRVFFTISMPLASRGILSGLVLMWARGMSEFGAVVFIAYQPMVAPILIWERFGAYGLSYARPVALLFILLCLVFFAALRVLGRSVDETQR